MKKKTLKIFINSFIVSLFTIWVANELFVTAPVQRNRDLVIPEQNIVLFLQSDNMAVKALPQPVRSASLDAPATLSDDNLVLDNDLFVWKGEETKGYAITSVEDVADIPLEHATAKNLRRPVKRPQQVKKVSESAPAVSSVVAEANILPKAAEPEKVYATVEENVINDNTPSEKEASLTLALTEDALFIPLQKAPTARTDSEIEIAQEAPESQVAMAGDSLAAGTFAIKKEFTEEAAPEKIWHPMEVTADDSNPWVVAKGTKHPKNTQITQEFANFDESEIKNILDRPMPFEEGEEVQVSEMVKNILIPIPEDILNDKNLTPQLVSPKKNSDITVAEETPEPEETETEEKKGGIFKSLTSIFSRDGENKTDEGTDASSTTAEPKKGGLLSAFRKEKSSFKKILPAEMKLSFQPGRAEISGQTLRWIEAFANKAIEDDRIILQIRIDQTSSFELQQKRLNLLHNILTNKGVGYHKIDTVLTSREPNSFIIRTLRINDNVNNDTLRTNNRKAPSYQSW